MLQGQDGVDEAVSDTTLLKLHQRLGHHGYDTVKRITDSVGSSIHLADRARPNCLTCAQRKQSRKTVKEGRMQECVGADK